MTNEKRLIDANKVFERADEVTFMGFRAEERKKHFMDLVSEILKQSTVDAVEVVHGRWVDRYGGKYANPAYDCSECKNSALFRNDMDLLGNWKSVQYLSDYCPNCGAKMDGDGNG